MEYLPCSIAYAIHLRTAELTSLAAAAALIDLMLAFLPIYFLWDVQISTRVKLGICCLTGLGVL